MSKKNKLAEKAARRADRAAKHQPPLSFSDPGFGDEVTVAILSNPHHRLNGPLRRLLMNARTAVQVIDRPRGKSDAVRTFERLAALSMPRLLRRQKQYARRASTAKHVLDSMDPESPFRRPVEIDQRVNLTRFSQAKAEIKARALHAKGRLGVTLAEARELEQEADEMATQEFLNTATPINP